jgi:DNA polymerase-1
VYELLPSWYGIPFAFDTETTGVSYRRDNMVGLALSFADDRHYYIVTSHTKELWDGSTTLVEYINTIHLGHALRGLFGQTDVVMVAHNAKFDLHFLSKCGITTEGKLFDTMIAAHMIDENRDIGLKKLAPLIGMELTEYSELPHYRGFKKDQILGVSLADVARYAMDDTEATWKLYLKFREELVIERADYSFNTIWMPALIVLQQMEARGIKLDLDAVNNLLVEYTETAQALEAKIREQGLEMIRSQKVDELPSYYIRTKALSEEESELIYTDAHNRLVWGDEALPVLVPIGKKGQDLRPRVADFTTGSAKQLNDLIFKYIDVDVTKGIRLKTSPKSREMSVDKDNLETLIFFLGADAPPILQDLLDWRKATKFITTYLERFISDADPVDDSISTNFNQALVKTGRLSSSKPNLQNIPSRKEVGKKARSLFVARENHSLLVADYGQMELRMLAHFSGDPALTQVFEEGRDLHILTASGFARIPYDELFERYQSGEREAWELRQLGKTGNFALTYGMGAKKFQRYLVVENKYFIEIEQANEWIKGYNETYKVADEWKKKLLVEVRNKGYVETIVKRRRRLPNITSRDNYLRSEAERQAINAKIQGSCSDVILRVMPPIQAMLAAFDGSLLLQVHDELVAEVPTKYAEVCANAMQVLMMDIVNEKLNVKMVASVHIGESWGAAKG